MARRAAERYRKKGVDKTAQRMLAFLEDHGLEGATVVEIGGGVGELEIELLKRGAARTLNLELSPAYDEEAMLLMREAGVEGRAERRLHDIASDPGSVGPADIVVLHRVVCCYPDYERLLRAAADHARRLLVFSYPPRNVLSRLLLGAQNLLFRLQRKGFRTFAHPPARMLGVVEERGLVHAYAHRPVVWQIDGFERRGSQPWNSAAPSSSASPRASATASSRLSFEPASHASATTSSNCARTAPSVAGVTPSV